jgi:hypothetical protein
MNIYQDLQDPQAWEDMLAVQPGFVEEEHLHPVNIDDSMLCNKTEYVIHTGRAGRYQLGPGPDAGPPMSAGAEGGLS